MNAGKWLERARPAASVAELRAVVHALYCWVERWHGNELGTLELLRDLDDAVILGGFDSWDSRPLAHDLERLGFWSGVHDQLDGQRLRSAVVDVLGESSAPTSIPTSAPTSAPTSIPTFEGRSKLSTSGSCRTVSQKGLGL